MNKVNKAGSLTGMQSAAAEQASAATAKMPSRRRLIKLGAAVVPVVATLASRPALAWHCQSPSAWGSEMMNPNTSLKTNAGHQTYPDETWYVANWKDNSPRNNVRPWDKFFAKYGAVTNPSKKWEKVKFSDLTSLGYKIGGFSSSDKVADKLRTSLDFDTSVLVAQLNFNCTPNGARNQITQCVTLNDLQNMASKAPPYNTGYWSKPENIRVFLYNNWLAR